MKPIERTIRKVDRFQQRHTVLAFPLGVMKKFGDDNAGVLASNLAFSAFGALFPLLLLLVTILGLVLANDPSARHRVLHSALSEFPIIGTQLGHNIHAIQKGSAVALVIALVGLVWSSTGLAQSGLFSMAQVWNLPGPERPNFPKRLGRSLAFLAVMAVGLIVTTGLASFGSFSKQALFWAIGAGLLAAVVNVGQYFLAFRVLTPKVVPTRQLWPGAVVGGIGWTILQAVGGYLVGHNLRNSSEVYGTFAIVLGLLAWVYLGVQLSIYAAEINTVLARRLWPRAMVQPPLTEADQRSLAAQAEQNQRRPEQRVQVDFTEPPMDQEEYLRRSEREPSALR
jgi:YihY family inner membrane protein